MNKEKLILLGGGGHCRSCIDIIESTNNFEIIGIFDKKEAVGHEVLNYKIIGTENDIGVYKNAGCKFLITVGQIHNAGVRKRLYEQIEANSASLATIISPHSNISSYAKIGAGTIIMHGAKVGPLVSIGINCIINTNSNVEHDSIIGNHNHISTNAVINGNCKIGNEVFIGSNATISNNIKIPDNVIIGAGGVVLKNIDEAGTYVGNPVKKIK